MQPVGDFASRIDNRLESVSKVGEKPAQGVGSEVDGSEFSEKKIMRDRVESLEKIEEY